MLNSASDLLKAAAVSGRWRRQPNSRIHPIMARYKPSLAADAARLFALGDERRLGALFTAAGFRDVKVSKVSHRFGVASFDEYFDHIERGWGSAG